MSMRKIIVKNETKQPMWIMIQTERCQVIETKTRKVGDTDFETFTKIVMKGEANVSLPADIAGIGASSELTPELKVRLREFYDNSKEKKYQWNGFVTPGNMRIDANQSNNFSIETANPTYYLSGRNATLGTFADNVPRSEDEIVINETGIHDKQQYKGIILASSDPIYFKALNGKFIGNPPMYGTFDQAPAGKVDEAGAKHKILVGNGDRITSGHEVRIQCIDEQTNNNCMYSTQYGSVYYKPHATWNQQIWKIAKTSNSKNSEGDLCSFGDEVKIINVHWPEAILTYDNDNWLRCHNDNSVADERKTWLLCSSPKG